MRLRRMRLEDFHISSNSITYFSETLFNPNSPSIDSCLQFVTKLKDDLALLCPIFLPHCSASEHGAFIVIITPSPSAQHQGQCEHPPHFHPELLDESQVSSSG